MFKKILIANRGEIACRVIKTAKKMGIQTVAVYSDADASGLHVQMADEAVHIGASASAESYLVIDRIVQACLDTGAEAVHPGFGFLSENSDFAQSLEKVGVVFVGPPVKAIAAMGDKIESKQLAMDANVSTVPGHMDLIDDENHALEISEQIGFPVMIKASAGGGGKGMRVAYDAAGAKEGFLSAKSEAMTSFGDDRIFIEKFIEQPRHIEIQVLGDKHGNIIYLGERECSIQRRHQKVVEEAPSPFLDEKTRKAMGEQAVALSRIVDYCSAGTVEFIVDAHKNFYFLEMNTRLQVEHPVTELVTGVDLVEQMLRVAYGEELSFKQKDVKLNGWSIETRVYAEDPLRGFLPSIGRLTGYTPPAEKDGVRVDTGVFDGAEISMFYDPMIAKLVTYADTREEATDKMLKALDSYYIRGINHNVPFLANVVDHPRFRSGELTTNFIAEEYPEGFNADHMVPKDLTTYLAVGAVATFKKQQRAGKISGQAKKNAKQAKKAKYTVLVGDDQHKVTVKAKHKGYKVKVNGHKIGLKTDWAIGNALFEADVDGKAIAAQIDTVSPRLTVIHKGCEVDMLVVSRRTAELFVHMPEKVVADTSKMLLSPMPGLLVSLAVEAGQSVKAGEPLAVVEAMKMENILKAEKDCVVKSVAATAGESLTVDQLIVEFE